MIRASVNAVAICVLGVVHVAGSPSTQVPRAEHPRPDLRREAWLNLNGPWQFCFDPSDRGLEEHWYGLSEPQAAARFDRRIVVPFCWQSVLAGAGQARAQRIGWYRRTVRIPESFGEQRVWLCFGAVADEARVWVNGHQVGQHAGAYEPFDLDITPFAEPGQEAVIVVRVAGADDAEEASDDQQPPSSTHVSGIWQTVYLEARPELYLASLRLRPLRRAEVWYLEVELEAAGPDGEATAELASSDPAVGARSVALAVQRGRARQTNVLEIRQPRPWSPQSPHLYDLSITLRAAHASPAAQPTADRVHTYFGLRTIECARLPGAERTAVLLNGRPIYLRGAVAPGCNPQGLCTAPSDDFLRREIEYARRTGLNLLRMDQRPAEPRQLYWADRLGMLVWQEVPGVRGSTPSGRQAWQRTMQAMVRRDINHPSVIVWGLFYEDRALGEDWHREEPTREWVRRMVHRAKTLDPSRLVVDRLAARPAHLESDLRVWRFCAEEPELQRRQLDAVATAANARPDFGCLPGSPAAGAPLVCGEAAVLAPDGGDRDVSFAFRHLITQLRRHEAYQGFVYSALTDMEPHHDGLLDENREPKPFGYGAFVAGMEPADLLRADFVGHEGPAVIEAAPGERFRLPVFVSHYSAHEDPPKLLWYVVGVDDLGREVHSDPMERRVVWKPFAVTFQAPVEVAVPQERPLVGAVCLELRDRAGTLLAANYVNLIVRRELPLDVVASAGDTVVGVEILGPRLAALRFAPRDFAALSTCKSITSRGFASLQPRPPGAAHRIRQTIPLQVLSTTLPDKTRLEGGQTLVVPGRCEVEYRVALPPVVRDAVPARIMLLAEAATRAPDRRLERTALRAGNEHTEAQARTWPGRLDVVLAGCRRTCRLPDDPADARGVLNWRSAEDYCAYGYLVREVFDARDDPRLERALDRASQIKLVLRAEDGRGLRLYGARSGRYPIAPTLLVETAMDMHVPLGIFQRETAARDCLHATQPELTATQ